jgi:hypothetical protein
MPSIWILYVNSTAPMTLSEITYLHWDAKFVFPFTGFFDMLEGGNIKWTLEKYIFALFFLGVGLITLTKRPSFSLLIIAQTLFYTGYVGIHAWGVPRYTGTIFLGILVLAEELNSVKVMMLMTSLFLTYGFIVLWEFVNWQIWLI